MIINPADHWQKLNDLEWPPKSGNACGTMWRHKLIHDLCVIRSLSTMNNNQLWIHVSVSRRDKLPSYNEIAKVKSEFIGDEREAFHILPKKEDHVNFHNYCIHMWSPEDILTASLPNLTRLKMEKAI